MLADVATRLRAEARATNERRLLVLSGDPAETRAGARTALEAADVPLPEVTLVGPEPTLDCEQFPLEQSVRLLGRTRTAVVLDAHECCDPNAIGRVAGAVDGGGILVLLAPPLDAWPDRRDEFDASLAAPPAEVSDVTGHFRRRLVETLRAHRGVAIVDVDAGEVRDDGLTHPPPRYPPELPAVPASHDFPAAVYEACRTDDQVEAVHALEAVATPGTAVVLEADRGRGKSSAAGLAAGALAMEGRDVLVTARQYRSAGAVFERARERLAAADPLEGDGADTGEDHDAEPRLLEVGDGRVRFQRAVDAMSLPGDPDVVMVDEAAALPVRVLRAFLDAPALVFATTVHGYEGAGRGFSVRFRSQLAESDFDVTECHLGDPIRYAAGDPVEVWAFRALLLDARPPPEEVVADARPGTVTYVRPSADDLVADEHLLRAVFGLLVLAHYRTEPADLARLLDAPNVTVRALCHEGHVVSVALVAREGNLPEDVREHMYDGGRVRGNMLPDVLTTQLRDESAGVPVGLRVLRIATHHAVRSRGLGSRLLEAVREEFAADVDWLGVGYGATPELVEFWTANGYEPVHLSTTRNDASGEYSVLMLDPTSEAGADLTARHARGFLDRVGPQLSDPLSDVDPDVVRATLSGLDRSVDPDLSAYEWRHVAAAAYGPGLFDVAPGPYRRLALAALVDSDGADGADDGEHDGTPLEDRAERLLVRKVLQGDTWDAVAEALDYHSTSNCMRALGDAFKPLVDAYGSEAARTEADRYR